ncbi:MAG TPA: phosphoribosylglycinamide formyltransferase [Hyphomonadaceae bacterium]|nr:phosphoribosylglycinamide formyltransferase [Hyphomonadaceae bacterium]
MKRTRLAILISGRGSNMEALVQIARDPNYAAEPVLVVSNKPDAAGLEIARSYGVEAIAVDHKPFGKDREAFERALDEELRKRGVEFIALAGFMRVLTPWFVKRWEGRMINIHPSLLPKYPGVDTHERALAAGDTEHGCSVHWVTDGVDEGAVIGYGVVRVFPGDDVDTLAARVLEMEHTIYFQCLEAVVMGKPTRRTVFTFKEDSPFVKMVVPAKPEV